MWREGVYPQRFGNATDEGRINQEQRVRVGYPAGVRKPCRQRNYAYFHQHTLADDMGRYHFDKADLEIVCEAGVDLSVLQRQTTQPRPLVSSSDSVLDRRRPPEQSPPGPLEICGALPLSGQLSYSQQSRTRATVLVDIRVGGGASAGYVQDLRRQDPGVA